MKKLEHFELVNDTELHDIQGGSIWSPVATVPVIIAPNVVKWILGFFK